MESCQFRPVILAVGILALTVTSTPAWTAPPSTIYKWQTVVNKNDAMPNSTTGRTYNSFNQPSVNAKGVVVFRARSRGGPPEGPPTRGIYVRDMGSKRSMIQLIAGGSTPVPYPNNIDYPPSNLPASFIEFPSIPRIGIASAAVATRGNHQPVWQYDPGDGSETRAGTSGVYVNLHGDTPGGELITGASKLGAVLGFEWYAVPGLGSFKPFDVFPGAPSITDDGTIAFKGNYTDGVAKTGVFYRELLDTPAGGTAFVELIANSDSAVPNPGDCPNGTTFGSTAPPSAAAGPGGMNSMVFVGFDNEASPSCGGIYLAPLEPEPPLVTLVGLDDDVPGEAQGTHFSFLGEGLSYDGRFVGFWGAWDSETMKVRLYCPQEGNRDRIDFCNNTGQYDPDTGTIPGDANSICDDDTDDTERCYQERQVPVNQGIFVHDTRTGQTHRVARSIDDFDDFVYWIYSGRVPGTGEGGEDEGDEDGEPARWRSSAFVAVSGRGSSVSVVFKARTGGLDPLANTYDNPIDGIYTSRKPGRTPLLTVAETGMPGQMLDPAAPAISVITALGIERDGFRGQWLVINATMEEEGGEEEEGMAGIYTTRLP